VAVRLRPLDQQVVVLTGASGGIGLTTAMQERGSNEGWHRRRSYLLAARTYPVRTLAGAGAGPLGILATRAARH
jgi:NADP-dependent 3-hydroxy acid dehydrogenase YdfG